MGAMGNCIGEGRWKEQLTETWPRFLWRAPETFAYLRSNMAAPILLITHFVMVGTEGAIFAVGHDRHRFALTPMSIKSFSPLWHVFSPRTKI